MYNFKNDYAEGAHPRILDKLTETNFKQQLGYGEDSYSLEAKFILKEKIGCKDASVFFLTGGTQTNLVVVSALLRPHEAVISVSSGHIQANEAGAIEATGHRIITVEGENGKVTPSDIQQVLDTHTLRPHVVKPKLVYISNATELGTYYTKHELQSLANICRKNRLYLYMDGARLGNALTARDNDTSLEDIAQLTDVFYIGGTKNGALLGEAVVFTIPQLAQDFDYILKQRGALLAKGRILGIQFLELFKDGLYFELAKKANDNASEIADAIRKLGYTFLTNAGTNQIFPILPTSIIESLSKNYAFYVWKKININQAAIRLITSWATEQHVVDAFISDLEKAHAGIKIY